MISKTLQPTKNLALSIAYTSKQEEIKIENYKSALQY